MIPEILRIWSLSHIYVALGAPDILPREICKDFWDILFFFIALRFYSRCRAVCMPLYVMYWLYFSLKCCSSAHSPCPKSCLKYVVCSLNLATQFCLGTLHILSYSRIDSRQKICKRFNPTHPTETAFNKCGWLLEGPGDFSLSA
jgi:hypothetical protein